MVTPNFGPYTEVNVVLKRAGQADVDLSEAWSTLEYEDALPQSVKITLNAPFGLFMTKAPIIEKFDKIYVSVTDANDDIIEDVFHVRKIKRGRKIGKNKQLTLFCPHQSENLWKRTISLVARRTSGADALQQTIDILDKSQNRGLEDPRVEIPAQDTVRKVGNFLDANTSNNYIFETVKLQSVFNEISDIEQQPIEGGGSFEAVFIRFKSKYDHNNPDDDDLNTVQVQAFPQGFQDDGAGQLTNIPNVTLIHQPQKSTAIPKTNILAFESDEDPELATNLLVVGDKNSGSYLPDWMKFQGAKDVFNNVKSWIIGTDYVFGNLVNNLGIVYECIQDNTAAAINEPGVGANYTDFWIVRDFEKPEFWSPSSIEYDVNDLVILLNLAWKCIQDNTSDVNNGPPNDDFWVTVYYVPATDYSKLTKANTQNWVNALAGAQFAVDATDNNQGRVCMIDPNVIVDDALHPRTFVRFVGEQPSDIPITDLKSSKPVDGYRVLTIDPDTGLATTVGEWANPARDRNGVLIAGNIVEYIDPDLDGNGEWVVFKSKVLGDDQEVFDWNRAEPWIKNPCEGSSSYVDGSGACINGTRATIWVIGSYAIQQIPLVGQFGRFFADRQVECAHSVKWDFTNHHIDMGTAKIINDDIDGDSAVFIKSEPTIIPGGKDQNPFYLGFNFWSLFPVTNQDDNDFAGGGGVGSDIGLPTFDFNNMFRDHVGVNNWFGPNTEDYLPIQKFAFWLQMFLVRNDILALVNLTDGDYELGIWLADRRDNIRIINMTQPRQEEIFPQEGNLPGEPYKGVPGASTIFSATEPDTTDAFDPREFLVGGIYTRDAFDKQGRYLGVKSRFNTTTELQFIMDGFRMVKPLVATNVLTDFTSNKPSRNIGTQIIKNQSIVSYAQLKNLVLGLEKIFNFERRAFKETTGGRCDIQFGDSVYYTDSEEINDTTDALPNTVKGVSTKNTISLSKGKNGPGGFTAIFDLVTRIWP